MGVAAHDGVDAAHARGHLQVHVHAVVAEHQHHLRALGPHLVNHALHARVLDAKGPIGHQVARVGNRGVGKGLANDGAGHAIDLAHHIGLEHRVAKVLGLDVLRDEFHLPSKVFVDNFFHPLHAQGELPVAGHHVHTQQLAGVHHVLAPRPQRRARALPGVAAVEQQGTGSAGLEALDQGGQVGKATHFAVASRSLVKVQIGQGMGLCRAGAQARRLEQVLTHQMRQLAAHAAHAQVDAGFAKVDGQQLRVAVGHVQKRHLPKPGRIVQALAGGGGVGLGIAAHGHACHRTCPQDLHEFTFVEVHG